MKIALDDSSLTDAQWSLLQPLLPKPRRRGRPPTDRRLIMEAIRYVLKGGLQWRLLPGDFPPWQTVYHVFRKWALGPHLGPTQRATARPRPPATGPERAAHRRHPRPPERPERRARRHGRPTMRPNRSRAAKRPRLVDTLGLVLGVGVTPASTTERAGAKALLTGALGWLASLRRLWVDGGYSGGLFAQWVKGLRRQLVVEGVKRSDDLRGFRVLPRRWVVERPFGWLMRQRRLVRDHATTQASAEVWIYLAMIRIQLRRLA